MTLEWRMKAIFTGRLPLCHCFPDFKNTRKQHEIHENNKNTEAHSKLCSVPFWRSALNIKYRTWCGSLCESFHWYLWSFEHFRAFWSSQPASVRGISTSDESFSISPCYLVFALCGSFRVSEYNKIRFLTHRLTYYDLDQFCFGNNIIMVS